MLVKQKAFIFIGCIFCLLNLFKNNIFAMSPFSGEFSLGLYHSLAKPHNDLKIQDKFDLGDGLSISLSFFRKNFWDITQLHHRTGLRLGYQVLRGKPVSEQYRQQINKYVIPDRIYRKFSVWYLVQIKILRKKVSGFFVDFAGGISLMTYDDEGVGAKPCNNSFICIDPVPNLGVLAGITYYVKISANLGGKISIRTQLHTGNDEMEYPFSKGIIFETGFSFAK
ncbi:MAG: hypothetical protein AB7T22_15510 [Calditrichaceae bacterium]